MTLIVVAIGVEAAFHAWLPVSAGLLVDQVLVGKDRDALFSILGLLVAAFASALVAGIIRDVLYTRLQVRSLAGLRQGIFDRLQHLSASFHETTGSTEIMEAFTSDLSTLESAWSLAPTWGLLPALESLVFTVAVLWLDWRVGLLSLLLWPWIVLAPNTFTRHLSAATEKYRDDEVRIQGVVEESLTARQVIRAFALEQLGINLFRKRNEVLVAGARRVGFLLAAIDRFTQMGILFLQIAILALAAVLAFDDQMTAGKLVAIPILTFMLAQSLLLISEYLPALLNAREAWERVRAMLHDPAPVLDKVNAKGLPALSNEITLRNVTAAGLEEVSATVKRGSYVAFVGRGGSGTAEIMKLLLRFHDPASGAALFDTHDLKSVTQTSIRARIGVVLRTNFMFNASVRENVRLTNPTTTEEKLGDLMHSSGVAAMAASLPQGMDTVIGENGHPIPAELQQRIAIARALLKNPDVLLLDNATSALDASAEKSVNETLRRLAKGRTLISVTHRLTSAADADLIYVFDGGRIVEQGSHAELIAADGVYGELWLKQAGFRFSADGSHVDVDAQRLKMFPAFHDIDEKILAELAPFFSTATYPPERDIVCQGDPCDQDCILVRGEAEVIRHDAETGESIVTGTLEDGDSFEESGLITRLSRTATVRARGVCTCISLERGQFESLIDRYPELRQEGSSTAVALKDAAGSRQS